MRHRRCLVLVFVLSSVHLLLRYYLRLAPRYSFASNTDGNWIPSSPQNTPLRIFVSTSSIAWNVSSTLPPRLFATLKSLRAPPIGVDAVTNTYTINQRIHSILVDAANLYWNPSIISLPASAPAEYILVARVLTDGLYQQSIICPANWTDMHQALKCIIEPRVLDIPPTSARLCGQINSSAWKMLANIPGLHDGRVMWTDRGEVLMIGGTQSRYTCFSLSLLTLSSPWVYKPLYDMLPNSPISYPVLTELRRPPPYAPMEKNWLLFFSRDYGTYAQYELTPTVRTVAKLIGNGYVTVNLTSPFEVPCLGHPHPVSAGLGEATVLNRNILKDGWHQATNSLKLVLCGRKDVECQVTEDMEVFIAVVQRKRHNHYGLVKRYERVVVIWQSKPPFHMLAVGTARILFTGEGWDSVGVEKPKGSPTEKVNSSVPTLSLHQKFRKEHNFNFMMSLAFDHSRRRNEDADFSVGRNPDDMHIGYLDDYLIAGVGIGDKGMGVVRLRVKELVAGLAVCPGFAD